LTAPPPAPAPETPRPRASHFRPILLTLFGGILLAFGSCTGFLSTLNHSGTGKVVSNLFAVGFFAGVLTVLAGGVWAIAAIILFFIRAASSEQ
jgi:hypothetical protein